MSKNSNLAGQVYTMMESVVVKEVSKLPVLENGHIFNSPDFQSLKHGVKKNYVLFKSGEPISRIWFSIKDRGAISGSKATFGSFDHGLELNVELVAYFIQEVIIALKSSGIKEISVKHWPGGYSTNEFGGVYSALTFKAISTEVNQHLPITANEFTEQIKYNERKKLNQCLDQGYVFRRLTSDTLPEVYELVKNTRDRKGFPVSMSFAELSSAISKMPDKYLLFGIYDKDRLIAAAVSIKISAHILYNFYHADALAYRPKSPLVFLVQNIYEYCQVNGIQILDFGISSENGVVNQGLFTFKKNLGCDTSEKITYQLKDG